MSTESDDSLKRWTADELAAYQKWVVETRPDDRSYGEAFRAGLEHARSQSKQPTSYAALWRETATEELIALRTIVLRLGPAALKDLEAATEVSEKRWHKTCAETDDYMKCRFEEKQHLEIKSEFEAVSRAMRVLEAARNRDEKKT